jgi:hypothetical protein
MERFDHTNRALPQCSPIVGRHQESRFRPNWSTHFCACSSNTPLRKVANSIVNLFRIRSRKLWSAGKSNLGSLPAAKIADLHLAIGTWQGGNDQWYRIAHSLSSLRFARDRD